MRREPLLVSRGNLLYGLQKETHMKAVVLNKFGPPEVLQLQEIAPPTPSEHEVLIRIYATTVTVGDSQLRSLKLPGLPSA
jgi:NADPH:quinone reductase-like Zn-dependent oxidoreductase